MARAYKVIVRANAVAGVKFYVQADSPEEAKEKALFYAAKIKPENWGVKKLAPDPRLRVARTILQQESER